MPRKKGKVKQTCLTFVPVESSSPAAERSPGSSPFRPAKLKYENPSKGIGRREQLQLADFSIVRDTAASSSRGVSRDEGSDSSDLVSMPGRLSKTMPKSTKPSGFISSAPNNKEVQEISSDEDAVQAPARRRRHGVVATDGAGDDDSDPASASSTPMRRKSSNNEAREQNEKVRGPSKRRLRSQAVSRAEDEETEKEASSLPNTRSATKKQRDETEKLTPSARTRRARPSAVDLSGLASSETSHAEELVTRPTSRKRRAAEPSATFVVDDDPDDSDDIILSSPAKRRRQQSISEAPRTPRKTSEQDKLDLEEDLRDLQDSAVTKTRTRGRLADSAKAKRQRHLEMLRRKRAGGKGTKAGEAEEKGDDDDAEGASDSGSSPAGPELQSEDSSSNAEDSEVESAVPSNEDLDRYEDDFVLEDSDGELGVPADLEEMPFEYTRHRYKPLRDCFRDVVEWMVHNKLNPAFSRNDAIYQSAFMKLDDEVKGRTGSQFISTVWNVDFRRALLARPHIEITGYPTLENHPCDACNRSGHPASSDIRFYGKPYSLETLEPLEGSSSDDEQEDGQDRDRDGHILPDEDTHFLLGRHCKSKAEMSHTLIHWRYELNEWVTGYLERKGFFEASKIVERSQWSQKKKMKYANEVVDTMDEEGEIQTLWRDFHNTMKTARETKEGRW